MNTFRYIAFMALLFISPKLHAGENNFNYKPNSVNSVDNNHVYKLKSKIEIADAIIPIPGAAYHEDLNEMNEFNKILNAYMKARNKVERPIRIEKKEVANGMDLKLEPVIAVPDQSIENLSNIKFMVQLTANFL